MILEDERLRNKLGLNARKYFRNNHDIEVNINDLKTEKASAWYGGKGLTFNIARLGKSFFEEFPTNKERVIDLCIHEFGHEYSKDHLSKEYYRALTKLGAASTMLAIRNPKFFYFG